MYRPVLQCIVLITVCSVGLLIVQSSPALAEPYFGKLVGELTTEAHGVRGTVYAGTDQTLYIREFYYDGEGPDAYVWMGFETEEPSPQGEIIAVNGSKEILGGYSDAVIRINLEDGKSLTDYKWLSIWCRQFTVNFGHVTISPDIIAPSPHSLGTLGFDPRVHNVHAEDVIVINHRQLHIVHLDYDGNGPDAFYWTGTGNTPNADGFAMENEYGSTDPLEVGVPFNNKNVTVTVPETRGTVFDIGYIGLWCVRFTQDFGHVDIPAQEELNVPPYDSELTSTIAPIAGTYAPPSLDNCEVLIEDTYQVRWTVIDDMIEVSLSGRIKPGNYLAFGISGSDTRTQMVMSDVTVVWIDPVTEVEAMAVDYYLSDYQQCVLGDGPGAGTGACPDELSQPSGTNDVFINNYSNVYGIITLSYTRPLNTGDTVGDKVIHLDDDVYIAWAIGPINPSGLAAKHRQQPTGRDYKINFGRENSTCPPFSTGDKVDLPAWVIEPIGEDATDLRVEIGQAGGQQGYEGITGSPGWGIAWYVNSQIIPEITVQRNRKYTFTVHGGNDPEISANYHPFYITNDAVGGYAQKTPEERVGVEIYAGPTTGSLCEWRSIGLFNPDDYDTFEAYRDSALKLQCETPMESGIMTWTPDEETPDVVYYHCYTHKYLGWRISVVDAAALSASISSLTLVISVLFAVLVTRLSTSAQ